MNNILYIEMTLIVCPECKNKNWILFKSKEEYENSYCMECFYPLYHTPTFIQKISYKYRKYFKVDGYGRYNKTT